MTTHINLTELEFDMWQALRANGKEQYELLKAMQRKYQCGIEINLSFEGIHTMTVYVNGRAVGHIRQVLTVD